MPIESTPLAIGERRFQLEARDASRLHARLEGRSPHAGLWVADSITTEDGGDAETSRRAFARAFAQAAGGAGGAGADVLVIETPDMRTWGEALVEAGFVVALRKVFVKRRLDDTLPAAPDDWRLRSLADVGERVFVERMLEASQGDPFEERKGRERDPEREWRELLESAGSRFDPARWHCVDDERGPIGVLLPQPISAEIGTLYYLGVVPGRRGAGLGRGLHALGLRLLAAAGHRRYVGSTDVRNAAMRAVFERNGASVEGTEAYYRLRPPSGGIGLGPGRDRIPAPRHSVG